MLTKNDKDNSSFNANNIQFWALDNTVEIVISEQWSWKVSWFLKEHFCPAKNHTTLHDHVLLVTFSTVYMS